MNSVRKKTLDVSCQATTRIVHYFLTHNFPVSRLIEGLPYSLAHLENVSASISWDDYLQFLRNCCSVLNVEQRFSLFSNYSESAYLRSLLLSGGLWLSPVRFFIWGTSGPGRLVEYLFGCIKANVVDVSNRQGVVEYLVMEGYTEAPPELWDAFAAGIIGTSTIVGMKPFLEVSWEPVERGARFRVQFPRRQPVKFAYNFLLAAFRRQSHQALSAHQTYLEGRESWLRDEIAERLKVEQALRESESQYRSLMESAPEAILVYDADVNLIVSCNRNAEVLFGQSKNELQQNSLFDLIDLPDEMTRHKTLADYLNDVLAGETFISEFNYFDPAGVQIPCEARLVQIPSSSNLLIRASVTNISARKKIERELVRTRDAAIATAAQLKEREQELSVYANRLREAIQLTNTGIFDHDHRNSKIYRSPEIQRIYGMTAEFSDQPYEFLDLVHPDDRERVSQDVQQAHDPNGTGQFQHLYRVVTGSGKVIWCEAHASTTFDNTDQGRVPIRTVGAVMDVTDRIEREQSLNNSRRQLQAILESNYDSVFSLDREFRYLAFNRHLFEQMKKAYGVEVELGRSMLDYMSVEKDREQARNSVNRALNGERMVLIEQYGEIDKLRTTYEITFTPMKDDTGEVFGVAIFARDISTQIQSQEALRELQEFQHLAIEASLLGIWKYSSKSGMFTLDERSQKLLGISEAVVSGEQLEARVHPEDLERVLESFQRLNDPADSGAFKIENRLLLPDGSCKWVAICATRFLRKSQSEATDEKWFIGTLADISEVQLTSQLLATSLQEKDAMLKEIHHRVKNNLQVISSLLSLQASDVSNSEVQQFSLESQRRVRAMALVHEMLYQAESLAMIDMQGYVDKLCTNLIQSYGPEKASIIPVVEELHLGLDQALPIGLILSELAANAFKHAFPDGRHGQINIELRRMLDSDILLSVTDNGVGLPANVSMFEETSLGLRLVNLLTRQLRGQLTISGTLGANFTIEIPHEVR